MLPPNTARTIVGALGNVAFVGLVLSPLPTMCTIVKKKAVEKHSPAPCLFTFLNCALWVLYSMPPVHPHSLLIATTNGIGVAVELAYVAVFAANSRGRQRLVVMTALAAECTFVAALAAAVLSAAHTHERRSLVVGVAAACAVIATYASPLATMRTVVETKSVEFMPLQLSAASFLCSSCWLAYGLLPFDPFVAVPCGIGALLAAFQLVLHAMFYKSTRRQMEALKQENAGHSHLDATS